MRQQRTQRSPVAASRGTTIRAPTDLPTIGYALIVDGHAKQEFNTHDLALQAAKALKRRYPHLQIKVYDAEQKRAEQIEIEIVPA